MIKCVLCLLIAMSVSAQSTLLELKIVGITKADSASARTFTVNYEIINKTDRQLRFFLNPNVIIPNGQNATAMTPFFKLFQAGTQIDASSVFSEKLITPKMIEAFHRKVDSVSALYQVDGSHDKMWRYHNHQLITNIVSLDPQQSKSFKANIVWNMQRYVQAGEHEYYLEADAGYFLELGLFLLKEQHYPKLSQEQMLSISQDNNFISGWLASHRVRIDLSE